MIKFSRMMFCFATALISFLFVLTLSSFAIEGMTACAKNNNGQLRLEICDVVDSSGCLVSEYCVEIGGSTNGGSLPDGLIAFFAGDCPAGWVEYEAARGFAIVAVPENGDIAGTQGTQLTDLEDRNNHTHSHNHGSISSGNNGSHNHGGTVNTSVVGGNLQANGGTSGFVGTHSHLVQISSDGSHNHAVNLPGITSSTPDTPDSNTDEDVLPYIQLRACITQSME